MQELPATKCTNSFGIGLAKGCGLIKPLMKALGSATLVSLLLGAEPALSDDQRSLPPQESGGLLKNLDTSHQILSEKLDALSERIDLFMGGLRVCEDSTDTYIQVGAGVIVLKDGGLLYDQILRANIALPNTQDRFRLIFESSAVNDLEPLSPGERSAAEGQTIAQAGSNSPLSAALQYATREKNKWNFSADAGVAVHFPPDPFGRLQFKRSFPLGEDLRLNFSENIFWFTSIGPGERTQLDLEKHISKDKLFRSTAEALWKERERGFNMGLNFNLFHELTGKDLLVYRLGVTAGTKPATNFTNWGVGLQYRRRLYQNWFNLNIEPALAFAQENQYQANPSIRIGFDVSFGAKFIYPEETK